MTVRFNVLGDQYSDEEPCFLVAENGLLFNRATKKWYTEESLKATAKARGAEFAAGEIGFPSKAWVARDASGVAWGKPEPKTAAKTPEKKNPKSKKSGDK